MLAAFSSHVLQQTNPSPWRQNSKLNMTSFLLHYWQPPPVSVNPPASHNVMSIDIDWQQLTTGEDGIELAETIRTFVHDRFQQVALPRFIRSVEVHSFEFGDQAPTVELKDVCDPLPDFYEEDEDDEEGGDTEEEVAIGVGGGEPKGSLKERRETAARLPDLATVFRPPLQAQQSGMSLVDQMASPILSRSSTPGIPGGTSNLSYFHLPLSARLHGVQSPFGAPPHVQSPQLRSPQLEALQQQDGPLRSPAGRDEYLDPSTRPSTAHSIGPSRLGEAMEPDPKPEPRPEPEPNDIQIVLRVSYDGNVRMSLTAEILLDYPMPSFVGIPLKLNVTGISFDGVALLAYLKKRAHFCFLGQQDAEILVGAENALDGPAKQNSSDKIGGLLREIKVETEIGQKEGGKQVLKNVGKVEKFVLEQVRRIFEDEFVYPSFWTFLV